jgi:uncharacterized repeat protein (TIGR02543 family)
MTTWNDILNWAKGSARANGACQGFAGNDFTTKFGSFKYGYSSANAALAASKAAGKFHTGEPPADRVVWVFYDYPDFGHVMLAFNGEALGDTSQATAWLNEKETIGTLPIHHYSYKYLGWSETNGVNTIPQLPTPEANPYGSLGVQMGADVVNRRSKPSTSAVILGTRAARSWTKCDGYTDEGQKVDGTTRWFHDSSGGWYSASVSAPAKVASLTRLNPDGSAWKSPFHIAPTPVPRSHAVTFDWNDDDSATTNATEQVADGQPIAAPSLPTRSGFTFAHWATDAAGVQPFDLASPVVADLTLYAAWTAVPIETEMPKDDAPPAPSEPAAPATPVSSAPKPTTPTAIATGAKVGGLVAVILALIEGLFAQLH